MFNVNKEISGSVSGFTGDNLDGIYTQALDKSSKDFKNKEALAERLAKEIENDQSRQPRLECDVNGDERSEEDKFSAVYRITEPPSRSDGQWRSVNSRRPKPNPREKALLDPKQSKQRQFVQQIPASKPITQSPPVPSSENVKLNDQVSVDSASSVGSTSPRDTIKTVVKNEQGKAELDKSTTNDEPVKPADSTFVSSSKLNPNAKEFSFNPNAKPFTPRQPTVSFTPNLPATSPAAATSPYQNVQSNANPNRPQMIVQQPQFLQSLQFPTNSQLAMMPNPNMVGQHFQPHNNNMNNSNPSRYSKNNNKGNSNYQNQGPRHDYGQPSPHNVAAATGHPVLAAAPIGNAQMQVPTYNQQTPGAPSAGPQMYGQMIYLPQHPNGPHMVRQGLVGMPGYEHGIPQYFSKLMQC